MKKISLIITVTLLFIAQSVSAQYPDYYGYSSDEDKNLFNHLGGGISLGTDGIGIDLATPVTSYLALRAGVSFMPSLKYGANIDYDSKDPAFIKDDVDAEAKLNMTNAKVLLDFYPVKTSSFHITAGAFIGGSKLLSAYNTEQFIRESDWGKAGIMLGDYRITSDDKGDVKADIKVNSFKPYLGIGFGRAVPTKSRVSVSCDFGVQFWGKPAVWTYKRDDFTNELEYVEIKKSDTDEKDAHKAFDIMSKIVVYPVLNIRLSGRFF